MLCFHLLSTDVDVPSPDEKSVITYVSSIYDAFPKIPEGGEGIGANVCPILPKRLSPLSLLILSAFSHPPYILRDKIICCMLLF